MAKILQQSDIVPPDADDVTGDQPLRDFSSGIQQNIQDLFGGAHSHDNLNAPPSDSTGSVGDIELVEDASGTFLYVKFLAGWKRFTPS